MSEETQENEEILSIDEVEEEEFEEITSEEVDRVVASLEALIDSAESENVKAYLEDALNNIYYLIYDDEEEEAAESEAA